MSETFSVEQLTFEGVPDYYSTCKGVESTTVEGRNLGEHNHLYGKGEWGEMMAVDSISSDDFGLYAGNKADDVLVLPKYLQEQERQLFSDFGSLDDLYLDIAPFQSRDEDITKFATVGTEISFLHEPKKEKLPLASLGILKNYWSGLRRLNQEKTRVPSYIGTACTQPAESKVDGRKLSTDDILRLAGENLIQSSSQTVSDVSSLTHPFASSFLCLSDDETKDVELVQYLLASAEKVGQQQYNRASKLLSQCDELSSETGNPVQRVVYSFAKALRERIDRETGRIASKDSGKQQVLDLGEAMRSPSVPALVTFHQELPFSQVCLFPGMQAIIERVTGAKKVHLIELEIREGIQSTVLMQALAGQRECPLEHLKITAVGTKLKSTIEETGERLMNFSTSVNLPFSFNIVMVPDILDLNEDLFELEAEEMVAVIAPYSLWPLLAKPDRLESLMRVLRNINPCIMVIIEVEANHNSPVFVNRFIEALFFFGAYFDCVEDCMNQNNPNRKISESTYFGETIRNIVAAEGEERTIRQVNIGVWRTFFARFGMMEEELSTSSLYQANLVSNNFACGSSCTFYMDGKCLIVGWKGTPLHSVSAWKFIRGVQ